jgi:hypothetical protein
MNQVVEAEDGHLFIPVEAVLAFFSKGSSSSSSKPVKSQGSSTPHLSREEVDSIGARSTANDVSRPSSDAFKLSNVDDQYSRAQAVFNFKPYFPDLKLENTENLDSQVEDVQEVQLQANDLILDNTFVLKHSKFKLVELPCILEKTPVAEPPTPTNMHYQQSAPSRQFFACSPTPGRFSPDAGHRCLSFHSNDSRHVSTQQDWN